MGNSRARGLIIALLAGVLGLTLLVQGALTTLHHRDQIRVLFEHGVANEMDHAAAFAAESLRRHDDRTVRAYLDAWIKRHPHIVRLQAGIEGQPALVDHRSEAATTSEYTLLRRVVVDEKETLTLTAAFSLDHLAQEAQAAIPIQVGVFLLTTLIFGLALWQMLNLVGVRPLLQEIERRRALETELVRAREAAESANRAKSAFLANISHELRTPLNLILGYAQLLERDPGLDERQHYSVASIHHSGDNLLALIKDTLELARIETGSLELVPTPCELPVLFREVCRTLAGRTKSKGLAFHYVLSSALPPRVEVDERRVREICLHLLDNAIKFSEKGEVGLEVGYREGWLKIDVRDTGIGIPRERMKAIFQPFVKVDDSKYQYKGTGLGLALVEYLTQGMGGGIEVESHPGLGSRFSVSLPVRVLEAPSVALPSPDTEVIEPTPESPTPPLPSAELHTIAEMAATGNLRGIKTYLEQIPAEYAEEPWVTSLRRHAIEFDLKALRHMLDTAQGGVAGTPQGPTESA